MCQELVELALKMRKSLEIKDRSYHLKVYNSCFIGSEAVLWLRRELNCAEWEAIQVGNYMIIVGFISHVCDEHTLENDYLFYRFRPTLDEASKVLEKNKVSNTYIVLGGGPIGCAVSLLLANQGHRVELYKSNNDSETPDDLSYPVGINPRGIRTLLHISLSLTRRLQNQLASLVSAWHIYYKSRCVAKLSSGTVYGISQWMLSKLLMEQSQNHPNITIHMGYKLSNIDFGKKILDFNHQGINVSVDASNYRVFACDGMHSKVRQEMADKLTDFESSETDWGVCFKILLSPLELPSHNLDANIHYIFTRTYTAPCDRGRWAMVLCIDQKDPEYDFLLSKEATPENISKLREYINTNSPLIANLIEESEYENFFSRRSLHGKIVNVNRLNHEEWIVLLGDAAHSVFPSSGESVNSGLEDALLVVDSLNRNQEYAFGHYNTTRLNDIQSLIKIANYLEKAAWDKQHGISSLLTNIFLGLGQKMYLFGPKREELTFGEDVVKRILPYSDIYQLWQKQIKRIQPITTKLVKWMGPKLLESCASSDNISQTCSFRKRDTLKT